MRIACLIGICLAIAGVSGCTSTAKSPDVKPLAFSAEQPYRSSLAEPGNVMSFAGPRTGLAGRTLMVDSISDIVLARNEVVLTFDDGPLPGKTQAILDALDRHEVKATFLMVGQMAKSYPDLVRKVAAGGHAIGSHTQNHANLAGLGFDRAVQEITQGRQSVAAALIPTGMKAAPFFRFPYLAETPALRRHLAMKGIVVIDADVDSKDYFQSTPDQIRMRTLARLEGRGSGIILFHDLHARTVAMLPRFLDDLHARGYKVVNLQPRRSPIGDMIVSSIAE